MPFHPRNAHQGQYDFPALTAVCPELEAYLQQPYGKVTLDFSNPDAIKCLNRALLRKDYHLQHWDIPDGYLCPPVPGRADLIHYTADLLGATPTGTRIQVLDIGVGANCIYPLLGHRSYGWHFVGTDVDARALRVGREIVRSNGLKEKIELRLQKDPSLIFPGIIRPGEHFHLVLCNPPFYASEAEVLAATGRKWKQLGIDKSAEARNFGGQGNELWFPGGERAFIQQMIRESKDFAAQVDWFTTLVSKKANLPAFLRTLQKVRPARQEIIEMKHGQKISRILAWRFS